MATDTLDLLEAIVKSAEAAAGKGAGTPLRADDWNGLAGAVAQLARLAVAREKGEAETLSKAYAKAEHAHLGQVHLAWFEPATRALVEGRGGAGDVAARLDGLARDNKALRGQVDTLAAEVERLRTGLENAITDNRVRDDDVRRLGVRLDGVIDLDRRVTTLDGRVAGIDDGVRAALAFRDTLRDAAGAPLDVAGLAGRVGTLEVAQNRLRLADGEVVRIRDFENRIAELERGVITDANLDGRLASRLDALANQPNGQLVNRAAAAAAASLDPRLATLEGGLAATDAALGLMRGSSAADRAQLGAFDARLAAETLRGDRAATDLARLDPLAGRLTAVEAASAVAAQRLAGLASVPNELGQLRTQVVAATELAPRVASLETGAAATATRMATAETAIATLPDLRLRIDQAETAATRADSLGGRVSEIQQGLSAIGGQVTVVQSRLIAVETLADRVAVSERGLTEMTSWRRGVEDRLTNLPTRASLDTLATRVNTVETRVANTSLATPILRNPVLRPSG